MTEKKLPMYPKNLAECSGLKTPLEKKTKLCFLVLTIGGLLLVFGCSKRAPNREVPRQLASQIRQAMAEKEAVEEALVNEMTAFLVKPLPSDKAQVQRRRDEELSRRVDDVDQRIQILSVQAIREAGLDPLRYELDSTSLRPQLRTLGKREQFPLANSVARQIRPVLDEWQKIEGEMTRADVWLDELDYRLSYLKGVEYSKTEVEIQEFQARHDQLIPRLRELNLQTNRLSSDVILATGHDPAWYELPTSSTKEGEGHGLELEEDSGQSYLVVYLKVPAPPTLWEQVVARLGFGHGPRR
jgi:hypothetical protein